MKTAEERDAMVNRVTEAADKWPTFKDMPEVETGGISAEVKGDIEDNRNYIAALYDLSFRGGKPIGRAKGAPLIVGEE